MTPPNVRQRPSPGGAVSENDFVTDVQEPIVEEGAEAFPRPGVITLTGRILSRKARHFTCPRCWKRLGAYADSVSRWHCNSCRARGDVEDLRALAELVGRAG